MRCPGQDTRNWKRGDVYDVSCPECGTPVEFFKDDPTRRCKTCGHKIINPKIDFGCAAYCQGAEGCLGDLPPELISLREEFLKDRASQGTGAKIPRKKP
jgi:ribosomal protein S27E